MHQKSFGEIGRPKYPNNTRSLSTIFGYQRNSFHWRMRLKCLLLSLHGTYCETRLLKNAIKTENVFHTSPPFLVHDIDVSFITNLYALANAKVSKSKTGSPWTWFDQPKNHHFYWAPSIQMKYSPRYSMNKHALLMISCQVLVIF